MDEKKPKRGGAGMRTGLYEKIYKYLEDNSDKLITRHEIMQEFNINQSAADSALYNAWKQEKTLRHIDKHPEKKCFMYGLQIPNDKAVVYIKGESPVSKHRIESIQQIREKFAELQNSLASLEDTVIFYIEEVMQKERDLVEQQQDLDVIKKALERVKL